MRAVGPVRQRAGRTEPLSAQPLLFLPVTKEWIAKECETKRRPVCKEQSIGNSSSGSLTAAYGSSRFLMELS
ncbi:hypothetical protein SKAU_G00325070 [Synaphobranchus kaupii]|uniref:Uncharacterized protein n=1 Tax=Synaphobranchus kaupii TaxID=118154 RepID=A0A9Q1EPJ8_SYNKA|nr:hypothetical protein SKAU_G00325070 [Synaphobranchus kaupii]